jgi:RecJ-like exonuclease
MIQGANWQADCPKCVASKFTCDEHYRPEIECPQCDGNGRIRSEVHPAVQCEDCKGIGWRPMTDDELADAAEAQHEAMCEGEPPVSMDEMHQRAHREKMESRA